MMKNLRQQAERLKTAFREKLHRAQEKLNRIAAVRLLLATFRGLGAHDATHMAAGVAYFALLSIFPLLLGLIAILGLVLPSESVQADIFDFFERNMPGSIDVVERNIDDVIEFRGPLGVIGLFSLLWMGSVMFSAVTRAINRAWGIRQERPYHIKKLRDLGMTLGFGLLILLSIVLSSLFSIMRSTDLNLPHGLTNILAILTGFLVSLALFLLAYRFIPNTTVVWRYVWPGALLAAILFEIAKNLFIIYLAHFARYELIYGSLASLIIFLVWIYISSLILIFGAEFTSQYHKMRMPVTRPDKTE
ncbi:MAG: YihY/virulence factor BrkB family protein [Dehalococcoidia bacterium]